MQAPPVMPPTVSQKDVDLYRRAVQKAKAVCFYTEQQEALIWKQFFICECRP